MARFRVAAILTAALLVGLLPSAAAPATPVAEPAAATPVAAERLAIEGDPVAALIPVHPGNAVVYAAGSAELYRSDDGGETWAQTGPPPPPGVVVAGPGAGGPLLAGERPPCARGDAGAPLQRSTDGGATWETIAEGMVAGVVPLAIWDDPPLAVAAGCGGLLISTDAGETWQPSTAIDPAYTVTALAPILDDPAVERAALVTGTSEGGTTFLWRLDLTDPAAPTAGEPLTRFWGTGALAGQGERYLAGTATGVHVSEDGGATWRVRRDGLEAVTVSVDPFLEPIPEDERERGFGIFAVAIDPADPDRLYAGTIDGLYRSDDGGAGWRRIPGVGGRVSEIVLSPTAGRLLAQTDAGVVAVPVNP